MIKRTLVRWIGSSLGLWLAIALLGDDRISAGNKLSTVLIAGLVLAVVNVFLKPIFIFFSLPAILITLGLFMIVVNGLLVYVAGWLYDPLQIKNFGVAMVAGIIIGLVNYLVTTLMENKDA